MPLYEVLLHRDDADEIRLTDQRYAVGDTIEIGMEKWVVEHEASPEGRNAALRYVCVRHTAAT